MTEQEICKRLDEISAIATERMNRVPHAPGISCAAISWMTDSEVAERHQLVQMLASSGHSRTAAMARLANRIGARRARNRTETQREQPCQN